MDKEQYKEQLVMQCHLDTPSYEEVDTQSDNKVYGKLNLLCTKYQNCMTKSEKKTILNDDWSTSRFYVLPKINKSKEILEKVRSSAGDYIEMEMPADLTSRPIVSGPKSVTKGLSKLLEKILTPIVFHLKTFIKDGRDFLRKFPANIGANSYIMCCDVKSLYTSISNNLGLQALQYWIQKKKNLIPSRFSESFIMESSKFVLENNYFVFNKRMWRQIIGTAMGKEMASPYACLTMGYLEETILFPTLLPTLLKTPVLEQVINYIFRFVDDGIIILPAEISPEEFLKVLNSMHPDIQFTITKLTPIIIKGKLYQTINFLSVKILTEDNGDVQTDIYYKDTNSHEYLDYSSHHPKHVKDNVPYCLAKTIVVFTSNSETMEENLRDLRIWLTDCGYPKNVIEKGIHNARLQGPANQSSKETTVPLVSTYYSNYDSGNILSATKNLIENSRNTRIQSAFKDVKFINSYRQPPNLLRQITSAEYVTSAENTEGGIKLCGRSICKLCALYLQECNSFKTSNGAIWNIKSAITCQSKDVIYFQLCMFCLRESNIGKTDNLRYRANNHMSSCRLGNGTDLFDLHVYECARKHQQTAVIYEPYFKLYVMMELSDYNSLRNHERRLHLQGHDTTNNPNRIENTNS